MVTKVPLSENPKGITIYAVLWPLTGVAGIFLALRIYSKTFRRRALWWDDYFIIFSWIMLLLSCCTTSTNVLLGFGLRAPQIPPENFSVFWIISNISGFSSVISVACSKTSFAITLLRLCGPNTWMRWTIYGLLALLNITHYLSAIFFWVSCDPVEKTYRPEIAGECWPVKFTINFSIFVGSCSAFCDFALALLPWRLLLRYNMYNREKIGVAIAMSMGIFAGITCIVKLTTVKVLEEGDFSYNSLPLVLWGFIEPACTIMAASIPMLRHLFKNFRHASDLDDSAREHSRSPSPTGAAGEEHAYARRELREERFRPRHHHIVDHEQQKAG
ncbi:uncharacterized protein PODANS_1_15860 [Podospora anserina S mat+]|uniref:Podospora anserina S mat+ genomic DNA chromosome 1, supercontig 4 n=1 Tax=Podospora anserina (strain S / ATCC MYA-4624 / DSM 980 / FGSC 10383) TaxID=515849 RepID=B2ATH3_PODAN|nr:uncharacterized protein PODANS_1_15860 [Podospora anserina S mat+]CAP67696.1 unnamed protein product [Podospora anserina S mat+]CDP23955.1 Putative protein of unknown function [Podospora anserina S mat+]